MRRAIGVAWMAAVATCGAVELKSPDGRMTLAFGVKDTADGKACAVWRVTCAGRPVIADSSIGLELQDAAPLRENLELVRWTASEHDSTWRPAAGERREIRDRYREAAAELREKNGGRAWTLTFRAYDAGIAWRYTLSAGGAVQRENSEFRFAADGRAWATYAAQGLYTNVPIGEVKPGCERPLLVELAPDLCAALGEARCVDFARMKFAPLKGVPHALVSQLDGPASMAAPLVSPWRFVMAADSPGRLLEQNDLILNLNDPCALADTSWIKPGKVLREVTLTTDGALRAIEFCRRHHLQYILFDAGWYGHEYDDASDARAVNLDPRRSKGPLDMQRVIRAGDAAGVGVILYVNRRALERQMDELFPLYEKWGVKGVKFGFVNVGPQKWTAWVHEGIRKAAAHRLVVDIHDELRPTGYSRTYPNLLTMEGIRGDEEKDRSNEQSLVIQFTRFLAGPADNTLCYFNERVTRLSTHAYQLGKAVCVFSPLQHLFWYDRPAREGEGEGPGVITEVPELEFFDALPVAWDDTRVLEARVGGSAVIARRSGDVWFVGIMQSGGPRTFELNLGFLDPARSYTAHVYRDDPAVQTRTHVRIDRSRTDARQVLRVPVPERGGAAVRLVPGT